MSLKAACKKRPATKIPEIPFNFLTVLLRTNQPEITT